MKKSSLFLKLSLLALLFISFPLVSCQNDELFEDIFAQNADDDTTDGDDTGGDDTGGDDTNTDGGNPDGKLDINTTPCDYTLSSVAAGATMEIECQLDLGGSTIDLPSDVTLLYKGGEIINGTLNFGTGGKIDGNLLNQFLEVEGNIILTSDTFLFYPERWDFVQGRTTSERAQTNNFNLEHLFEKTKLLGATTFSINEFDAYFEISKVTSTTTNQNYYPSREAVNLPSDFTLRMTENTHLRTQPNGGKEGVLISFRDVSNSSIVGGNLHGERDEHDYSGIRDGEGGNHLMVIHGANNITVDGVNISDGSKGGLFINSIGFTFQPDYIPANNIVIKNCVFERNRRMSVALTDGNNILFEGNTFIDTALPTQNSDGGVVGFAVNIEAVRTRDDSGNLVLYERVYDVTLRNNIEQGSRVGAFNIYTGENVVIENNQLENKVSWSYASGARIRQNTFTASEKSKDSPAISAGGSGETVFDNQITDNLIIGYGIGISAYHKDLEISKNKIQDARIAIQVKNASNMNISDNEITSNDLSSRGVMVHITAANSITISQNDINVKSDPLYFVRVNQNAGEENNKLIVSDNMFNSDKKFTFSETRGVEFKNNTCNTGIQLLGVNNFELTNNNITTADSDGIRLTNNNSDIDISGNTISVPPNTRYRCINNDSSTSSRVNIESNNICQ
ncbi:right-handed parallel beta-helix repeat-containing protein [Costertonia aggregata]|uniref:Right-handed parallel beta-helix repeat-containing protein n=1 Tax=Costertonia aggregata TaxID=343403 RepID=A0A7H9ATB3_9FLAO|nr:right-handed parallel beta-helix repeat-containing protein [Costertonia aggregata]QLG46694.1 right-handed parallel beta-helix repeat-containing protein [Costertonia aggregata]